MIGACATNADSQPEANSTQGQASTGGELYQQHCASCHLADLSGDPDGKLPNDDGSYPPPPHDSSGHTWHHSDRVLHEIIRDGSDFPHSRMPSLGEILSDATSSPSSTISRELGSLRTGVPAADQRTANGAGGLRLESGALGSSCRIPKLWSSNLELRMPTRFAKSAHTGLSRRGARAGLVRG